MAIDFSKLTDEQLNIANEVVTQANLLGIDPNAALSLSNIESNYNQSARSPVGAIGVMQLMPGTAKELNVDPLDLAQNIKGGLTYYKQNLDKYKDPYLAAIAYNAGPGVADKFLATKDPSIIPTETLNYVSKFNNLYTPSKTTMAPEVTVTPKEDSLLEPKLGTVESAAQAEKLYELNQSNIAVSGGIGAGIGLITSLWGPAKATRAALTLGKRVLGGGLEGSLSSLGGELYKAGKPENFDNDVNAMAIEFAIPSGATVTRELIGRLPTALTNLFPGDLVTKYLGKPLKTLLGGETESEFLLKQSKFGKEDPNFAKRVKPGTSTDIFSKGWETEQQDILNNRLGIPVKQQTVNGKTVFIEKPDVAAREYFYKNIDDLYKNNKGFSVSPQFKKLQQDLAQSVKDGYIDANEYAIINKIIGSQSSPTNAAKFKTTLLNLAQQSEDSAYKVYQLDKTAQSLLTNSIDDYLQANTGKIGYSILKKIEGAKSVATARDSIPVLISGKFAKEDMDLALNNLKRAGPEGVADFKKALGSYFKVLPEKDMVEEFNRLSPYIKKSKVIDDAELITFGKKIAEYRSVPAKATTLGAVMLKDSLLGLLSAEAASIMPL
jgi:hypothetical protein